MQAVDLPRPGEPRRSPGFVAGLGPLIGNSAAEIRTAMELPIYTGRRPDQL